jgi:hypothetical protein
MFALLPIALVGGTYWYTTGGRITSTDDAYADADKVGISADVSGIAQDVIIFKKSHGWQATRLRSRADGLSASSRSAFTRNFTGDAR